MEISNGFKLVLTKAKGKSSIEIVRHGDPIMDNILIINSVGSTRYENTWIIEKDLPDWLSSSVPALRNLYTWAYH